MHLHSTLFSCSKWNIGRILLGSEGDQTRDPLFPHLFVIIMDHLSSSLDYIAFRDLLGFHPSCRRLNLIHLSIADDLLILMDGSVNSLQEILKSYPSSINTQTQIKQRQVWTFPCGHSPWHGSISPKYLWIQGGSSACPLSMSSPISSRLSERECVVFTDHITSRIRSWKVHYLNFAGRL